MLSARQFLAECGIGADLQLVDAVKSLATRYQLQLQSTKNMAVAGISKLQQADATAMSLLKKDIQRLKEENDALS